MGVGARGVGRRLSADDLREDAGGDGEGSCGKNMLIRVLILMVSTSLLCKTRPEQRSGERASGRPGVSCTELRPDTRGQALSLSPPACLALKEVIAVEAFAPADREKGVKLLLASPACRF